MIHPFSPSAINQASCAKCNRLEIDHTDRATCEVCGNSGNCEIRQNDILMCSRCWGKEFEKMTPDERVEAGHKEWNARKEVEQENSQIKGSANIFNAKLLSINQIKELIDKDDAIPAHTKHFELAKVLDIRFQHLKQVLFEMSQTRIEHETELRAIQTYYTDLSKKIRENERAQLKLVEINYQPAKPPEKVKKINVKKNVNNDEIKQAAKLNGIPEAVLKTLMVAKGCDIVAAVRLARESGLGN